MTARTLITCDGFFDQGRMSCRATYPTACTDDTTARLAALHAGWTAHPQLGDLCPAHSATHKR